jgi:hypothetical protein
MPDIVNMDEKDDEPTENKEKIDPGMGEVEDVAERDEREGRRTGRHVRGMDEHHQKGCEAARRLDTEELHVGFP